MVDATSGECLLFESELAVGAVGAVTALRTIRLLPGEFEYEVRLTGAKPGTAVAQLESGPVLVLDITLTDELRAEGYARDVVRAVQDERKAAGLHVADRIHLTLAVPAEWRPAVQAHEELIARETLAFTVTLIDAPGELAVLVAKAESS